MTNLRLTLLINIWGRRASSGRNLPEKIKTYEILGSDFYFIYSERIDQGIRRKKVKIPASHSQNQDL